VTEDAFYLDSEAGATFTTFHHPEPGRAKAQTGILLLPPFGWDDLATYRARRDWAVHLASRGHGVMRIDLPGTGDSAGSLDDRERWEAWHVATSSALRRLQDEGGFSSLAAIGIGMSGFLAYQAAAEGLADDIVLWATPAQGRRFVREFSAFSALETTRLEDAGADTSPTQVDGIEAGGFLLGPELAAAIGGLTLAERPLPPTTRVLLLDRDGVGKDETFASSLRAAGIDASVAHGRGFAAMLAQPDQAQTPHHIFPVVDEWLAKRTVHARRGSTSEVPVADRLILPDAVESHMTVVRPFGTMRGILTRPLEAAHSSLAVVFLNAGAIRRTGPSRLWVESARRWAGRGVTSLRIDLEGIGDTDGDGAVYQDVARFHDERLVGHVHAVLDELQQQLPDTRFVLVGMCSGGYWAFQAMLHDDRVAAAVMINPRVLYWHEHLDAIRDLRRTRLLVRPVTWKRLLRGDVPMRRWLAFAQWFISATRARLQGQRESEAPVLRWQAAQVAAGFTRLAESGKRARFIFCDGEPLRDELIQADLLTHRETRPNVFLRLIPGRDHTLRPLWMHPYAEAALDEAITEELAVARSSAPAGPASQSRSA
jgi:pimeloyl-ACP methyl ester carboxylesterase